MKNSTLFNSMAFVIVATLFSSCSAITGIFKAGMGFGIFLVILVIVIIVIIVKKAGGK